MAFLHSILFFFFVLAVPGSLPICSSRKMEPGYKEAIFEPLLHPNNSNPSTRIDPSKVVRLSWHPRAFLYKGFLSDDECDHLISSARGKLKKSFVIDNNSRNSTVSNIYTGSGMSLARGQDEIVSKIEERISAWTFLPRENGEDMLILHYKPNESYKAHFDYYQDISKLDSGGNRLATVLMYLSNVAQGGETIFPQSELKDTQYKDDTWSDCATDGYAVKPMKGDGLLFFNHYPDVTPDDSSLHGGCMVVEGEKWSATKYIHARAINLNKLSLVSDDDCTDEDVNCANWVAMGECQRNPVYMLGTPDYYGTCRKSCGACQTVTQKLDKESENFH